MARQRQVTDKIYQERLRSDLERLTSTISELEEKREAIARGDYDHEFLKSNEPKRKDAPRKGQVEVHASIAKAPMIHHKKRKWDDETREEKLKREAIAEKHMGHYYKMCKIADDLSNNKGLSSKLRHLPSNKGIVYKGVYFFGYAPDDGKPASVSEYRKGMLLITEWDTREVRYYEEVPGGKRKLVSKVERRRRNPLDTICF
jgi:hypothetical protein